MRSFRFLLNLCVGPLLLLACNPSINDKEGVLLDSLATKEYSDAYLLGKALPTLSSFGAGQSIRWSGSAWEVYTPGGAGAVSTTSLADGAVTSAKILDGTIVNGDISDSAAIAVSKLAVGTNGQFLVTSSGVASWSTLTSSVDDSTAYVPRSTAAASVWSSTTQAPSSTKINDALEIMTPPGIVQSYAGASAPTGWLLCDGSAVSRTTYARLFAVIGTTFGVGDGSTTFNLPDLRGRVVAGKDDMGGSTAGRLTNAESGITGTTLGASGGVESVTLSAAQSGLPAHTHGITDPGHTHSYTDNYGAVVSQWAAGAGPAGQFANQGLTTNSSVTGISVNAVAAAAASSSHSSVQPTIVLNSIIKY